MRQVPNWGSSPFGQVLQFPNSTALLDSVHQSPPMQFGGLHRTSMNIRKKKICPTTSQKCSNFMLKWLPKKKKTLLFPFTIQTRICLLLMTALFFKKIYPISPAFNECAMPFFLTKIKIRKHIVHFWQEPPRVFLTNILFGHSVGRENSLLQWMTKLRRYKWVRKLGATIGRI